MLPPSTNRLIRTAKLELDAAGTVAGEVPELRWCLFGARATIDRRTTLK